MTDQDVVNINRTGWCAFCCSNFCYCSPDSLKRQVRHLLDTVKERNEQIEKIRAEVERLKADLYCALENPCDQCKADRDRYKAMCEKMAEALERMVREGVDTSTDGGMQMLRDIAAEYRKLVGGEK